ncbi:MAG: primosomal protein N' [Methylomonas sp.]|nr:MAG: primosomal protein N' [Methylomonas sp.]PPD24458.1 MAG: primosomal protein N' [Methylomonas sp.]PPD33083.1 MAG: primosomal protein N' [Methylomonas sp.]PPD42106.1 MAG: primosomal protein N' [Methylomonas sp.]PPD53605.1 MAG: primosomal protein N' [Methylomonas sp.]
MANCETPRSPIVQVAIAVPLHRLFDYLLPLDLSSDGVIEPGIRVRVPFGKHYKTGIVMGLTQTSDIPPERLKAIEQILDTQPLLSDSDFKLLSWASRYYHHPLGEVVATALPVTLRQGKPAVAATEIRYMLSEQGHQVIPEQLSRAPRQQALLARLQATATTLAADTPGADKAALKALLAKGFLCEVSVTPAPVYQPKPALAASAEQQMAIASVSADLGRFSAFLLEGVTGSGKTEVYMQIIADVLQRGLQVLVLLPEITLTPQLEQRFRDRFAVAIVCYHSKLTDSQRLHAWLALRSGDAAILLGTRSALFTPMAKPGLIILDEEHDPSFKQQEGFRFSARDVAIARAKMLDVPVLLGSATPSLESLYNVQRGRYRLLTLSARAGHAVAPQFTLLDIRNKPLDAGLSEPLIALMRSTLAQGQQVLLFLNRRGFAPVLICHGCGWVARCGHCDANLVIHAGERRLRCHHCNSEQRLPDLCPACGSVELHPLGMGTERIEQSLASLFPDQTVVRLDRDTTQRKGALEHYLDKINQGEASIILGTQMLAKGHHFPGVTLVAIVDIDSGLFSIDFHAAEKLAQMIVQVGGRAGRADKPGRVILQTRQPEHPLLTMLLTQGYPAFARLALAERQQAGLPPFSHQALIRAHASHAGPVQQFLHAVAALLRQFDSQVAVLGPVSAPMARRAGQFRFQLLLQSPNRQALHQRLDAVLPAIAQIKAAKTVRWSLDIDPVDLY